MSVAGASALVDSLKLFGGFMRDLDLVGFVGG